MTKKASERTTGSREIAEELPQGQPKRDSAIDCFSDYLVAIHVFIKMYSILTTTLRECRNAVKLRHIEDVGYSFVSWDQLFSKLSQDDISLSGYYTRMNPLQLSDIPCTKEMTLEDRIISVSWNKHEHDENFQNIGIISELLCQA